MCVAVSGPQLLSTNESDTILDTLQLSRMLTMPTLLRLGNIMDGSTGHAEITVTLSEWLSRFKGKETMRCVFETKLAVDIDVNDDKLRKAFIDMVTQTARNMYGPTVMLAKNAPTISVSMTSRSGKVDLPLFETVTQESEDD